MTKRPCRRKSSFLFPVPEWWKSIITEWHASGQSNSQLEHEAERPHFSAHIPKAELTGSEARLYTLKVHSPRTDILPPPQVPGLPTQCNQGDRVFRDIGPWGILLIQITVSFFLSFGHVKLVDTFQVCRFSVYMWDCLRRLRSVVWCWVEGIHCSHSSASTHSCFSLVTDLFKVNSAS